MQKPTIYEMTSLDPIIRAYRATYGNDGDKIGMTSIEQSDFINKWVNEGHTSPLKQSFIQVSLEAPMFVVRQLSKHQIGMAWNEQSRRYSKKGIAMAEPGFGEGHEDMEKIYKDSMSALLQVYYKAIEEGIPLEKARMILPQSAIVHWVWCGSFLSFANLYWQRTSKQTQEETREWTLELFKAIEEKDPMVYDVIVNASKKIAIF